MFCASPNYTLVEEYTFLDTRIPDQVTASQDHSLYAVTPERINVA